MDTNRNQRKRIAHIGGKRGEAKLQQDDVVYDIMKAMDSMNTSESNLISFQQHEARSKKKRVQVMNNAVQYCADSTNSEQPHASKQMKKVFRERTFPLMAKCQKSWKFLKKNRCIPKPRAHVGTVIKPPQRPIINTKQNHAHFEHSIFSESVTKHKAYKKNEKRNVKRHKEDLKKTETSFKKHKPSHFVSCSKNEEFDEHQFTPDFGSDTDSEYEKFVQKHHLKSERRAKRKPTISSESDASSVCKKGKIYKKKKQKRKRIENESCASTSKITSKKLSDTEDSSETLIRKSSPSNSKHSQNSSKIFQENTNADTSDEDVWNEPVYDFDAPANYDSSDCSEDKQGDVTSLLIDKSVNEEHFNVNDVSEKTNALPLETNIISQSNSVSDLNAQYAELENMKARCNVPCYILLKRDPIIEKKVVSLFRNEFTTNKMSTETNFAVDDDDCIIVNESTKIDSISPNPNEVVLFNKSTSNLSISPKLNLISETSQTDAGTSHSGYLPSNKMSSPVVREMLTLGLVNQTGKEISSSDEVKLIDPITELQENNANKNIFQIDIGGTKQISENNCSSNHNLSSISEPQASSSEGITVDEMEECVIVCEKTAHSHGEEISSQSNGESHQVSKKLADKNNEVSHELELENCKTALSEDNAEKSLFNVQILSVKSLDQSESAEIIDITEDTEETVCEAIHGNDMKDPNETVTSNNSKAEDSDIEIICLDSSSSNCENNGSNSKNGSISKEVGISAQIKTNLEETHNCDTDGSLNCTVILDQEDCIILDETDTFSNNTIQSMECNIPLPFNAEANLKKQLKCDGKSNLKNLEGISNTSDSLNVSSNDSASNILKILDTIDFDTINRVVQATMPVANASILKNTDNGIGKNNMPSVNSMCEEGLMVSQNYISNSENQLLLNRKNKVKFNSLPDEMNSEVNNINLNEKSATVLTNKNETSSSVPTILNDNVLKPVSEITRTCQNVLQSSTVSSTDKDLISNNESFSKGTAFDVYSSEGNRIQNEVEISGNLTPLISGSLDSSSCNVDNLPDNSATNVSISENVSSSTSNKACISILNEPVDFGKPCSSVSRDKNNFEIKSVASRTNSTSLYKKELRIAKHRTMLTRKELRENFQSQHEKRLKLISSEESPSDELDIVAAKSIQDLDESKKTSVGPLLELYKAEYKKYMNIKSTEKNVSAGLKLLQENQAKKLMHISLSIKNLVQHDSCLYKVANKFENCKYEYKSDIGDNHFKTENSNLFNNSPESTSTFVQSSSSTCTQDQSYDCVSSVKIFNPSVVQSAAELVGSKSPGSLNNKEVYNHLINSVCAECGKHALAACLSCAKVYYCSEECGKVHWSKGHFATCRR